MANIRFELQGGEKIARSLLIAASEIKDFSGFFSNALDDVEKSVDENFSTQGATTVGGRRKKLAASTEIARIRRRGYYKKAPSNPGILRWTGNLQDTKSKSISSNSASIEYTAEYAKFHQFGLGVPKRQFINFTPKLNAEITRSLQKHINDVIGIANLR